MKKVLIFAVAALFMTTISAQNNQNNSTKRTNTVTSVPATTAQMSKDGLPEMTFEEMVHDYGTITQGDNGTCYFEFKNTGKADLILTNCSSSCGCTVPDWPKEPIVPGEKGKIKVTYNTQRLGGINKMVYVDSNIGQRITLKITGTVNPKPTEAAPEATPSPMVEPK